MYSLQDLSKFIIGYYTIVGTIFCFFGYRFLKVTSGPFGFILGSILTSYIWINTSSWEEGAIIAGIIGGIIGAALMVFLNYIITFLMGAILGMGLGAVLFKAAGNWPELTELLIPAFIGGVIALIFHKFMTIVSTAAIGAFGLVIGIASFKRPELLIQPTWSQIDPIILLCTLVLGIFGVIFQYRSAPAKKEEA